MKACEPRSMPLAQVTSGADPGSRASRACGLARGLRGRRDQDRGRAGEPVEVGRRRDGFGEAHARQPVAEPCRLERRHRLGVAAPQHDGRAGRGGGVGERHAPGAGARHTD